MTERSTPPPSPPPRGRLASLVAKAIGMTAALAVVASTLLAFTTLLATPAHAAPGDPFPAGDSYVFVAQGSPSQLYSATTNSAGSVTFTAVGSPTPFSHNGLGYRTADNYLYAVVTTASTNYPVGSLVRIGQEGAYTRVGTAVVASGQNVGSFGPNGNLYTMGGSSTTLNITNPDTGATAGTVTLNQAPVISDFTFANGFLWGLTNSANAAPRIARINPSTGAVTFFAAPAGVARASAFGAAWTFGNGNLGFSSNDSGTVYQIAVANPAATTPTFTLAAQSTGPASSSNDGAASPGQPTDLSVVKTGPAALIPGGSVTYTLTVTNNGPGNSTGYVVNDTVPAPLTTVGSTSAGCTVAGNAVRCVGSRLVAGASAVYTITAAVPANATAGVANTGTVTANEQDTVPGNNTSTTTSGLARLGLVKNAGTPVDVNDNGLVDAGDTIQYTFDVTNTGTVDLTSLAVNDAKAGAVTCPPATLAAGATTLCQADAVYTITAADATAGSADNTATAVGTTPDNTTVTSSPSSTSTPVTTDAPAISLVKTADVTSLAAAGETVTYAFLVTNTGNVPLSDVTVDEGDFSGTGELSAIVCPAGAASLAPSAEVTCTATYVVTQADIDTGTLTNSATATGTPPAGTPPVSPPSEALVEFPASPAITLTKTATPTVVTSVGQNVAYSFEVTNDGNVTLTAVTVTESAFSGSGGSPAVSCPTGPLAPAAAMTCTASYATTASDIAAGEITNTAVATGTPPSGSAVTSEPSSAAVSVFRLTLPLTGGTSAELVVLLGAAAMVVAILIAFWHLRRLRRALSTPPASPAPLNTSSPHRLKKRTSR
jgi:uncharacterized repeat protein (TIGR01451 family)/LPXTG-motif cell wall-anchored protein